MRHPFRTVLALLIVWAIGLAVVAVARSETAVKIGRHQTVYVTDSGGLTVRLRHTVRGVVINRSYDASGVTLTCAARTSSRFGSRSASPG